MVGPVRLLMYLWWYSHIDSWHVVSWFAYISDLEFWSAFDWSIIFVLLRQHSFGDAWTCFSICSLRLCMCFFIASSLSISQSVLFGDILCLMLVTISHWGIPPSLSPPDLLMFFSHCSIYFLIFASRHIGAFLLSAFLLGHSPIFGFSTSCAGFMVVRPICRSLRVIT